MIEAIWTVNVEFLFAETEKLKSLFRTQILFFAYDSTVQVLF